MSAKVYEIRYIKSPWGNMYYYGYINDRQYTEDFYSKEELIEKYQQFKHCINLK